MNLIDYVIVCVWCRKCRMFQFCVLYNNEAAFSCSVSERHLLHFTSSTLED